MDSSAVSVFHHDTNTMNQSGCYAALHLKEPRLSWVPMKENILFFFVTFSSFKPHI